MSPANTQEIPQIQALVRKWLTGAALPLWAGVGRDAAGGFVEQLTLAGVAEPDAARRIRVQARQIYVYSHASVFGLGDWADTAHGGFTWMTRHGWDADRGGFRHMLEGSGAVLDDKRDTYDHAFILFSLAWLYRATGDREVLAWIEKAFEYVDRALKAAQGPGYLEGDPPVQPRRQNPHMHLLEAFLALHAATGETVFKERIRMIAEMFQAHFFNPQTRTLTEFFDDAWQPAPGEAGQIVEPGHLFEWVYLLDEVQKITGLDVSAEQSALFDTASERGIDDRSGLVFDQIWRDGGVKTATKRCWPQTEALRAHAVMARRSERAKASLAPWLQRIFTHYLDPAPAGAWLDVVDDTGTSCARTIPASTLYHLMSAFAYVLEAPEEGPKAAPKVRAEGLA